MPDMSNDERLLALRDMMEQMRELQKQKSMTMAELIRWCERKLTQTEPQRTGYEQANSFLAARQKLNEDKKLASLYLQWLATRLEDETLSDDLTLSTEGGPFDARPINISQC